LLRELGLSEEQAVSHRDDFTVPFPVSAADVVCAQKAVIVHSGQAWPHGMVCANCHGYYPCRVNQRGRELLIAAGWDDARIEAMVHHAQAGFLPWPVLSPGWRS
jgi:hypothetical protein